MATFIVAMRNKKSPILRGFQAADNVVYQDF